MMKMIYVMKMNCIVKMILIMKMILILNNVMYSQTLHDNVGLTGCFTGADAPILQCL